MSDAAIARSVMQTDYLRRGASLARGHREWLHFCIDADGIDLIINLSVSDDLRPAAAPGSERVRLTLLVCRNGVWDGDSEEVECALDGGHVRAVFSGGRIELVDGVFVLNASLRSQRVAMSAHVKPMSFASAAYNVRLAPTEALNWVVVPRCRADGWVRIGDAVHALTAARAYHDHNWGTFNYRGVAWQWGHASDERWSVVMARVLDRAQATAFVQSLLIWRGERQHRVFRGDEVDVEPVGWLRPEGCPTFPRVATLLAGGAATELPRVLRVRATGDGDSLEGEWIAEAAARIAVPDDEQRGMTLIHEVTGALRLAGTIRGERVSIDTRAVFELLRRVR